MSTEQTLQPPGRLREKTFFGHPRGLLTLFNMEVWERFSFYGMQAILLIYLYYETTRGGLHIAQPTAIGIVGAYGSAVYLATIAGGWLADRVFGAERTLYYAGWLVMCGHIALALLPGVQGVAVGLVLIALGSGGVKATCASLVGTLYDEGSPQRDAGFSIFYMGINIGAFLGPLLTGALQQSQGFHYGFGIAAIGMAFGLFQYSRGRKRLPHKQDRPAVPLAPGAGIKYALGVVVALVLLAAAIALGWLRADNLAGVLVVIIALIAIAYFVVILCSRRIDATERSRVQAFIPLFVTSAAYWAMYGQSYTVVTAFFDQRVNRHIFGWEYPVGWLVSYTGLSVVIFAGLFAWLWSALGRHQPGSPVKFILAAFIMGLTFLLYLPYLGAGAPKMPLLLMAAMLLGFTFSELCISPIGLSVATKLAPKAFQTQLMALNYLSLSLGFAIGGHMGTFYSRDTEVTYFLALTALGVVAGIFLLFFLPFIRRHAYGAV